jgi:hypothetical protein
MVFESDDSTAQEARRRAISNMAVGLFRPRSLTGREDEAMNLLRMSRWRWIVAAGPGRLRLLMGSPAASGRMTTLRSLDLSGDAVEYVELRVWLTGIYVSS